MSDQARTRQRRLLLGWGASVVLLVAAVLVLLLTSATALALVLFLLGVISSVVVTLGMLRERADLQKQRLDLATNGRGVHSLRREPPFAIAPWSFVVPTPAGTLLWDPPAWIDDEVLALVRALGEVAVIATSHPHMFGAQLSWSRAVGDVPVLVNERSREWLPEIAPVVRFWDDHVEPLPGVDLVHVGGHMLGSAVVRTPDGSLLVGDTVTGGLVPGWVSFQRNFPKHIPFSAAVVRRIVDRLDAFPYDRLYTLGGDTVDADAQAVVHRSAETHIRWVSGEFDHLT